MAIDAAIEAYLQGNAVRVAHLVEFCFLTQSRRLWNGHYMIHTGGHDWFGLRKLGSIEGIDEPGALEAQDMKFSVSGVDSRFLDFFTMAVAESRAEYIGCPVRVFLQFFDDEWQLLGDPVARAFGIMDGIGLSSQPVEDNGASYTQRIISISAQNFLSGRRAPSASFYTTTDQNIRSPGDRGLEHIAELIETRLRSLGRFDG